MIVVKLGKNERYPWNFQETVSISPQSMNTPTRKSAMNPREKMLALLTSGWLPSSPAIGELVAFGVGLKIVIIDSLPLNVI